MITLKTTRDVLNDSYGESEKNVREGRDGVNDDCDVRGIYKAMKNTEKKQS